MKTSSMTFRIDPDLRTTVENVLAPLGVTITEAFNMFLHKIILENGIPFTVKQPRYNAVTEAAMEESRRIARAGGRFHTMEDLIASLEEDDEEVRDV